jgi:hypothetical protein
MVGDKPVVMYKIEDVFTKKIIYQISAETDKDIESYLNYIESLKKNN